LEYHPSSKRFDVNSDQTGIFEDLTDIVLATQFHRCGSYCERQQSKYSNIVTCRFAAPWKYDTSKYPNGKPPQIIINDDESNASVVFSPNRNHFYISNYNPWTSLLWRANNDAQAIFSYDAVIKYLVKYVTKGDFDSKHLHSILARAVEKADKSGRDRIVKKLMCMVNSINNEREISIQECLASIMGIDLRYISSKVR
jgi:hypothetical protein